MQTSKMGIRSRLLLTMGGIVAAFLVFGIPYFLNQQANMKTVLMENKAAECRRDFNNALTAKKKVWLTNALQLANNPLIQRSLNAGDRKQCFEIIDRYNAIYKQHTSFKRVNVLVVDKDLKVFVKSWDAAASGETVRSEAMKHVRQTGKPLVVLEAAEAGLRLKGLFPVFNEEEMTGIVNFEGGLNSIRRTLLPHDLSFLYFLPNKDLDIATGLSRMPRLGDYSLSIKEIDEAFLNHCTSHLDVKKACEAYVLDDDYLTVGTVVKGHDGKEAGIVLLGQKADIATNELNQQRKIINMIFGFACFAMMAMIAIMYWSIQKNVLKPLGTEPGYLSDIADSVAKGDTRLAFDEHTGGGGGVYGAMQHMVRALSVKAELADRVAQGDLSREVQMASDRDRLGAALSTMVRQLSGIVGEVRGTSDKVRDGAEQISGAAQSLSQGATESAASLEQINASMGQISGQVRQNAKSAQQASDLTSKAKQSAEKGYRNMQTMATAMHEIKESSEQIDKIIKSIDDIAFQTNLLALNAAVEAARAGKHGKGFAVVAQEVRALAQRTEKAAKETTKMIASSNLKVENGAEIAVQTETSLTEIVEITTRSADLVAEIAAASEEQDQGLQQVGQGLSQIEIVTQQNTASAEECAAASAQLSSQAHHLQGLLQQFVLKAPGDGQAAVPVAHTVLSATSESPAAAWGAMREKAVPDSTAGATSEPSPAIIHWGPDLSVGVDNMDAQHQKLVDLINALYSSLKSGKAQSALRGILDELVEYTKTHFAAEEALLRVRRYPELDKQEKMHDHFVERITDMCDRFDQGSSLGVETMNFLKDWLMHHIQKEDRKYGTFLNQNKNV